MGQAAGRSTLILLLFLSLAWSHPGQAQTQTERALQLQKTHREALRTLEEFQQRWSAGKVEEAYALSKKAESLERELIAAVEKDLPGNTTLSATFREILGSLLTWQADRDEDRDDLETALAARRESLALARSLHGDKAWQAADARRLLSRTEHGRTLRPADRRELVEARTLNRTVLRLDAEGKWSEALLLAQRALAIRERLLGPTHPDCAVSLANLGGIFEDLADYARALPLARRSLEIQRTALGEDHPEYARGLNNLAVLYQHMGDFNRSEPCYRQALQINKRLLGEGHPEYAASLNNLATLYRDLGKTSLAEPLAREALEITRKVFGEDDPGYSTELGNLAAIYQANDDFTRAEPLYRQALAIREKAFGENHPGTARSLNNLASVYVDLGDVPRAEALFRRSRDVWRQIAGDRHPEYARSLHNLAGCYEFQGDHARSEPLFREALAIRKAVLGDRHPLTALTEEQLALVQAAEGRWNDAADGENRSRRAIRRHIRRVLPSLTARDQLSFLRATDQASLSTALSLGLARRDDPRLVALSAGWVLNGKGVVPEALAEQSLLARQGNDPALAESVRGLQDARAELARAIAAAPGSDPQASRRLLARLEEQEEALSARLEGAGDRPRAADPWVELDEVRAALPAGSVLVEVARILVYDFAAKAGASRWQAPHYAAWLIPARGAGEVRLLDLGDSEPIDLAVAAFRKTMEGAGDAIYRQGEAKAEAELRKRLDDLARRVLRPMEPVLAPARRWFISPDASLWLVPWGALPLADGRYSVEAHTISDVVTGRDLVVRDGPRALPRTGLIVADPDFDLAASPLPPSAPGRLRSGDSTIAIPTNWQALPGTADEAGAILPRVQAYLGAEPALFAGDAAVERVVKTARQPRVVLLCTHGFFLPDQDPGRPRTLLDPAAGAAAAVPMENPLLRCGLVLAGANQRDRALDPNGDDGILTGLEVLAADLRGTELVVLSACETGLGSIRNGQGVAGLRQAFQLAGARAVMSSLWKIPDEETVDLMSRFWENLAAGKSQVEAFHAAQRSVIGARREAGQAAHPLYWAAFTLSGRVDRPPPKPPAD